VCDQRICDVALLPGGSVRARVFVVQVDYVFGLLVELSCRLDGAFNWLRA